MKILFSSCHNPHFLSFPEYVQKALSRLGHEVKFYDYRKFLLPGRIRERFPSFHKWDLQKLNKELTDIAVAFRPDLFLTTWAGTFFPETIRKIKQRCQCLTVNWFTDYPGTKVVLDYSLKIAGEYDYFFCLSTDALEVHENFGNKNGRWLPAACDPDIHKPMCLSEEEKRLYGSDICFVGSWYPCRERVFSGITDFNLAIWGPGWEKVRDSKLKKNVRGAAVRPETWTKIFSGAKIVVNYAGCLDTNFPEDKFYQVGLRLFETMACKVFQLHNNKKDLFPLFQNGKHLVFYDSSEDLREKIVYYLNRPREREKIAEAGYNEAINKHTYSHRMREMLRIVKR